jgi:hypothetical protein
MDDNAMAESFVDTSKTELLADLRAALRDDSLYVSEQMGHRDVRSRSTPTARRSREGLS